MLRLAEHGAKQRKHDWGCNVTTFQIIIRKIAIHFSKPIWSFVRNCVFWLFRLDKIKQTKGRMSLAKGLDIDFVMVHFKWQPDKVGD